MTRSIIAGHTVNSTFSARRLRRLSLVALVVVVWGGLMSACAGPQAAPAAVPATPTTAPVAPTTPTTRAPAATATSAAPAATPAQTAPTSTTAPAAKPTATQPPAAGGVSYAKDIQPIFDRNCVKCHGGDKTEVSLVLKSQADVMKGSENGAVVEPGKPGDSYLIELINNGKMPKKGSKLSAAEIALITKWVEVGAPNN
jgi:cytochrome c